MEPKYCEHCGTGPECGICGRDERTARWWEWVRGGWVKLSLRPGEELRHSWGGPTDEGFTAEGTIWRHVGNGVERDYCTWGRDCDGRHEYSAESFASLDDLAAESAEYENGPSENVGIRVPHWTYGETGQRDYTAEAAGY